VLTCAFTRKGCNSTKTDAFYACSDKAYYHKDLQIIAYSDESFTMSEYPDLTQTFEALIDPQVDQAIAAVQDEDIDTSFVTRGLRFDRIFSGKRAGQHVFATLDIDKTGYYLIGRYEGIDPSQTCQALGYYRDPETINQQDNVRLYCKVQGDTLTLLAKGFSGTAISTSSIDPLAMWSDLTGKLRFEDE
jgi:hypothetical protein